jgi:SIR2-like domain
MEDRLRQCLLDSIEANRLVIFCGAGLSMASPSNLPSAKALAVECAEKYEALHGPIFPQDVKEDLEKLAEYFETRHALYSTFISGLIPRRRFIRDSNAGHIAAADFLISGIVEGLISTNVDVLIEEAAKELGESYYQGDIDGNEANMVRARKPHLKIHGCLQRDDKNTVWCKQQVENGLLKSRHEQFRAWLSANLRERDLLFVGFWSDWSYLNDIFQDALGGIDKGLVVIVNLSDEALLQSKAPKLWTWSGSTKVHRFVVNQSADTFLAELRTVFWRSFIERLHRQSLPEYVGLTGNQLAAPPALPAHLSCDDLYTLHLDTCGTPRGDVARKKRPENSMQVLGAVQIGLLAQGARLDGNHYLLDGTRIRVVNGQGRLLSAVRKLYESEPTDFIKAETTICVGAKDDGGVPPDVVRTATGTSTIVRAVPPLNWLIEDNAKHVWARNGDHDVNTAAG